MHGPSSLKESLFFVAWENDTQIGYLKVNIGDAQTEIQDPVAID